MILPVHLVFLGFEWHVGPRWFFPLSCFDDAVNLAYCQGLVSTSSSDHRFDLPIAVLALTVMAAKSHASVIARTG
jgi:hypothetical protein